MENDIELALKAKNGDDNAYSELMKRHYRGVLNYVYRFMGGSENAEDITQEVFLRVYKSIKNYEPEAKFTTWLYKIATNLCLTKLKKLKKNLSLDEMNETIGVSIEDKKSKSGYEELFRKELRDIIFNSLGKLPEKEKIAITLCKYEGFSYNEVAEVLDCSLGAVKTHIYRGRMKLIEDLKEYIEE
ncbi:MAG: sigma-70 family RNA polymerase sigma factor [Candidatus Dadabacteria bacterium]|nr:sigma-70 family RNA polymerase sigma factor [Candidatus Dadabacteria bacterium]NIQ14563.1 sigma-70 family RNA polymerase sigma factor [Candidatus Dadabacteria bacterium]